MRVAVLISTYNGGKYLKQQIDSIVNQTGDFEIDIYVRDDGSNDDTQKILDYYQKEKILKWFQGSNLGPALSFLELVYTIKDYDFYAFSDQDDVWDTDKIAVAIDKLTKRDLSKPCIYCSNNRLVDQNLNLLNRNAYKKNPTFNLKTILVAPNVIGCTMVFNHVLSNIINSNKKVNVVTMHDSFLARLCLCLDGEIIFDNNSHMSYRQHGNNVIGVETNIFKKINQRLKIINKKTKISIADQANEILRVYKKHISDKNICCLKKIANYKKNILSRIRLACDLNVKFLSFNMGIMFRMSILLGNR